MQTLEKYRVNAEMLAGDGTEYLGIINPFLQVLRFVIEEPYRGACHASSAILYVLLRESNIDATINIGELGRDNICFDHSWVEVGGKIFDVAIARPDDPVFDGAPVFMEHDLDSMKAPLWQYGTSSGIGDDPFVEQIKAGSFATYMNNAPFHTNGLWHYVQKFGKRCGLKINLNKARQKYSQVQWRFR